MEHLVCYVSHAQEETVIENGKHYISTWVVKVIKQVLIEKLFHEGKDIVWKWIYFIWGEIEKVEKTGLREVARIRRKLLFFLKMTSREDRALVDALLFKMATEVEQAN